MDAKELINRLDLTRHPEGGWYRETYRSAEQLAAPALPERFSGVRSCGTAIYFLLEQGDFSSFHRIKSDEIWHYYAGSAVMIHLITPDGKAAALQLGPDVRLDQQFQIVIPAGCWFGAEPVDEGFALVGCTVAPGFDFADFELADCDTLLACYPEHATLINRLTRKTEAADV
jgi:uncharacterized protein